MSPSHQKELSPAPCPANSLVPSADCSRAPHDGKAIRGSGAAARHGAKRVLGVDITPAQLDTAREMNEKFGLGLEFLKANAEAVQAALDAARSGDGSGRRPPVVFTAHSIPVAMAATSDYQRQLTETGRLVMAQVDPAGATPWSLAFQSRSGPPAVPWLEPDIVDQLRAVAAEGVEQVVVAPIGFVADHMEVVYDLDVEAAQEAERLGLTMVRAATAGVHPAFVTMIRQLIEERLDPAAPKLALGSDGPYHDTCPVGCCPGPRRPTPGGS